MFFSNFQQLCDQNLISITALLNKLNISKGAIKRWKEGGLPNSTTLQKLADYFGVTTDYLLNGSDNKISSSKTEDDISSDLNKTLDKLYKQQDGIMFFDGEPIDDETKELLTISLENTLRLAKEINKQKGKNKK